MILLKQTFCWDWVDVLYFVTNQRVDHKVRNTLRTSDLNSIGYGTKLSSD